MNQPEGRESKFNTRASEFCPPTSTTGNSRFAFLNVSNIVTTEQRGASCATSRETRRRSNSTTFLSDSRRPVMRAKVSNFSSNFIKSQFVEYVNDKYSGVRSIDFQPRYNKKGKLFGFITFDSEIGFKEFTSLNSFSFNGDLIRIEKGQDKEGIPTSTTLVAYIDDNITPDEWTQWLKKQEITPLSFTFHWEYNEIDGSHIVFIQYRNIEDAGVAWGSLNDEMLGESALEVEYKKKNDRRELDDKNHPVFLSLTAQQIWKQMQSFKSSYMQKNNSCPPSMVFPHTLTAEEKSIVFTYAEKLGLCHYTRQEGENKVIMISNTPPTTQQPTTRKVRSGSLEITKEIPVEQRRTRRMSCPIFEGIVKPFPPVRKMSISGMVTQRIAKGPVPNSIGFTIPRTTQ